MPASYTPLGLILQATGENESTWGAFLNAGGLSLIDDAIRGRVAFTLSGSKVLTSTNGTDTEARKAILHVTGGTGGTVTIPNYSKAYFVINEASGNVIITAGGAMVATVAAGDTTVVISDGSNVRNLQIGGLDLKAYIDAQAFASTDLPGINPGTAGLVVGNDGVNAGWVRVGYSGTRTQAAPYTVVAADKGAILRLTGTGTVAFDPSATLGATYVLNLINEGTGDVTLDPAGAETIDGLASFVMYPGEARTVYCDGAGLHSIVLQPFSKTFTASGTFVKPPGYKQIGGRGWGGGSGGAKDTTNSNTSGGPGGGCQDFVIFASTMAASVAVTIGAGGAAQSTTGAVTPGAASSLGTLISISGGGATNGGGLGSPSATPAYLQGALGAFTPPDSAYGGSAPSIDASAASSNSIFGGGAGGSMSSGGIARPAGTSIYGGSGGAAVMAASGTDGVVPGGGGGATRSGAQSGAGARGELRLWGIA